MKVLRNILALVVGLIVGGGVNMALVIASPLVIPPPAGVDVSDPQSLSESMHLFEPKHFVFPFLAHALGTLVGALVAYLVAASHRPVFAYVIGARSSCSEGSRTLSCSPRQCGSSSSTLRGPTSRWRGSGH